MHIAIVLYANGQYNTAHTCNHNPASCSGGGDGTTCSRAGTAWERLARFVITALMISCARVGSAPILELELAYIRLKHTK